MSETNRLYSEYEMKQLPISNIAQLHARTEYAILHKLAQEFLINASWNDVKGWKAPKEMTKSNAAMYDYEDDEESDYDEADHDSDSDYEEKETEYVKKSVVLDDESLEDCDDPNDSDYVDEEDEDDDDDSSNYEDEEEQEFDAYSIPQKVSSFRKLVDAAKFFIYAA